MNQTNQTYAQLYAQLYDETVHDWPSEIDFYRNLISKTKINNMLEVACGTGRVLLKLIRDDLCATGIDLDVELLDVALQKAENHPNVSLYEADMRSFEFDGTFQLVTIPGHSFQFMTTPHDQVDCLNCIKRHLEPGGLLVVHLDNPEMDWLGDLTRDLGGVFESKSEVKHPETGNRIRTAKAWSYEPATQTNSAVTRREELNANGEVINQWVSEPTRLHCVFRFEMEHLLARAGFVVEALYGDFSKGPLQDDSSEMVWIAKYPG